MKDAILSNLDNPGQLERLYRQDKAAFRQAFRAVYPELGEQPLLRYWHERLNYAPPAAAWPGRAEVQYVAVAVLLAGLVAKLPALLGISDDFFYPRNIGFIVFPVLTAYFAWKNKLAGGPVAALAAALALGAVYINLLPDARSSDTLVLACVHLLLFLWAVLGVAFVGGVRNEPDKRLAFLRYNGDLVVITALFALAGGLLSAITLGLFELIGLHIGQFYAENVLVFAVPAAPIVGTVLTRHNPQLVGRVSPLIARLFGPLVLLMLVVYLLAMAYSGQNPYTDRDFLLVFNALLVGVMAIIFFSVSEASKTAVSRPEVWVLALLSGVTVVVNGVALSAILFRISTWGITPNRAAVLGSNVLILINLLLVLAQLVRVLARRGTLAGVGQAIAWYLPLYAGWAAFVAFGFPALFGFR